MTINGRGLDIVHIVEIEGQQLNCTKASGTEMTVTAPILPPGKFVVNMFDRHGRRVFFK